MISVYATLLISTCLVGCVTASIKIGAFKIKSFGEAKLSRPYVRDILSKIVLRYDILMVQEIKMDEKHFYEFVDFVNRKGQKKYTFVLSDALGSSTYKERYGFIYRNKGISISAYQFPIYGYIQFERPPFIAHIKEVVNEPDIAPFFLVGLNARPSNAVAELNNLAAVYNQLGHQRVVFLGNFNAACDYVNENDIRNIPFLFSNSELTILIKSGTNIPYKDCAYDRIVITKDLDQDVISPGIYNFRELTPYNLESISDRYPVEFELKGATYMHNALDIGSQGGEKHCPKCQEHGALEKEKVKAVFRTLYADILEQINPDDIAAELYSKSLISLADREDVDNLMHSGHSRATVLLNAVERAVKADHNNVMIFVEVLHCIPKYKELAIKLCKAFH